MSDAGTDSFVGVVIILVAAVAVVAAVSGDPLTSSSSGSGSPTSSSTPAVRTASAKASTNIPGGALFGCTGDVISDRTVGSGDKAVNLKVYYSTASGGRNCAVATKTGTAKRKGPVEVTLKFAGYDGKAWPKAARHRSTASASRAGAVYLDDSDGRCVSAVAVLIPTDGSKRTTVDSGRVGCG